METIYLDNTEQGENTPHTITHFCIDEYDDTLRLAEGIVKLVRGRIQNARQNNIEQYLRKYYKETK